MSSSARAKVAPSKVKPKGKEKPKPERKSEIDRLIDAKLATSMLDPIDRRKLQIQEADYDELKALKLPHSVLTMEIPYFGIDGKPVEFRRWRYLQDSRTAFEKLANKKERRYVQQPDTLCRLYFPPLIDWAAVAKDTRKPIVITEGELKAACCVKVTGTPCIGLGGVYSFKSNKKGVPLIRDFGFIEWEGRDVVVAFDSDAESNPMVVAARNALCKELHNMGAIPTVAQIPAGPDGEKQGLDDYALNEGPEALRDAFEFAEKWGFTAELHKLNEEVCYVKNPGLVIVLATGQRVSARDFVAHSYANRHYTAQVLDANGNSKMVQKPAAKGWIEWPKRLELRQMVYTPGEPQITDDACFNTWAGWGCEPVEGDIEPWKRLLDHIFQGYPEERSWFERWLALPIQQPGAKMFTAAVIWGIQTGTGKSLIGYTMGRIYGTNFAEIGDKELADSRNEWAENKQFVLGDDVTGQDQRRFADRLKAMITQKEMRIDRKYVPSFTVVDRINYMFTSNHPDAFFLEDDDRRFFVHEADVEPLPRNFYADYMAWMEGPGPAALFHYLLHLDLKGMDHAHRAPDTAARRAMVADGQSDIGQWIRLLKDAPDSVLRMGDKVLQGDLWSSQDLLALYDPERKTKVSANGITRELKRANFKQVYKGMQVKLADGRSVRLFAVRNRQLWTMTSSKTAKACAQHYEETRLGIGGKAPKKPAKF